MNAVRYAKLVLWSFFGVRRGQAASEELDEARPLPLILTAIILVCAFVGVMLLLATYAVGGAA